MACVFATASADEQVIRRCNRPETPRPVPPSPTPPGQAGPPGQVPTCGSHTPLEIGCHCSRELCQCRACFFEATPLAMHGAGGTPNDEALCDESSSWNALEKACPSASMTG